MGNPRLDWMDKRVILDIDGGNATILLGLLTGEWSKVRQQEDRKPYFETLDKLRQYLIEKQAK